jgi:hypothetical protein
MIARWMASPRAQTSSHARIAFSVPSSARTTFSMSHSRACSSSVSVAAGQAGAAPCLLVRGVDSGEGRQLFGRHLRQQRIESLAERYQLVIIGRSGCRTDGDRCDGKPRQHSAAIWPNTRKREHTMPKSADPRASTSRRAALMRRQFQSGR